MVPSNFIILINKIIFSNSWGCYCDPQRASEIHGMGLHHMQTNNMK